MSEIDLLVQDAENRQRALAHVSFIVEAPAGAGKTELLTQRYLGLLATVKEPEEIVAITFTNKAAAEMRGRILDSLQDAANQVPVDKPHKQVTRELALQSLARSGEQGWGLLAHPGRLRITTIDSLSSLLARQMPLMSRFGAQPAVTDDANQHYQEAAQRTLAMLESGGLDSDIAEALAYFDNDAQRLSQQLADMLKKRDQWLPHAGSTVEQDIASALHYLVQQDISRAALSFSPLLQKQLMPAARFAAAHPKATAIRTLLDWQTPLTANLENLPQWRAVCEMLLTKEGTLRKEGGININNGFPPDADGKAYKQVLVDIIAAIVDPKPLVRIRDLPDPDNLAHEWRIISALSHLLNQAAAQLMLVFQEVGEVDFVEVALRALHALHDETGPTDLALQLDYRIQHLLVDEFQDTSPAQIELLQRLTSGWQPDDGRTIFCVGDPMQSIYRFRKADVGLFLRVAESGIGHLRLKRLQLTRNNRSRPAVVDWVNQAFARVFPAQDSVARGAISYREFVATRDVETDSGVQVHPLVAEATANAADMAILEARYLADLIARERKPGRTIAVLVRARSHLHALVAEIRRNRPGLDFQAVEMEALVERQTVQDALALTKALFHRADRVNWLAILRAPWCGLTLADLHALAAHDHRATIWQLMQRDEVMARLTNDGRQRLLHLRTVIAQAFAHQGRQSARRWVESVWLKLGGAQCLVDAGDVRDVQAFFDLIDQLDRGGQFDAAQLESAMADLYAAPDVQADGSLQFMTLHKSKGLQFDTVILPGLHRPPNKQDAPLLLWESVTTESGEIKLLAAPQVPKYLRDDLPSAYDYLHGLENERTANEAARVLYVGATRAERKLHLLGVVKADSKGDLKPANGSFLQLLWESVAAEFLAAEPQQIVAQDVDAASFIPKLIRLPQPAVPALLKEQTDKPASLNFQQPTAEPGSDGNTLDADTGTLAHRYVEIIAQQGLQTWTPEFVSGQQAVMEHWLTRRGHKPEQATQSAQRVIAALQVTLASEQGQWALKNRPGAQSELKIDSLNQQVIKTQAIDRTFVEDGVRWIIDYKSVRLTMEHSETVLAAIAEQHRLQLEGYAALFADEGLPIKKAIFFLALGKLVELS